MNADIKGWVNGIKNPGFRLLFGVLISGIIAVYASMLLSDRQRVKEFKKSIEAITRDRDNERRLRQITEAQLLDCKEEKYLDAKRQAERLENRLYKQDTAKQIIEKLK